MGQGKTKQKKRNTTEPKGVKSKKEMTAKEMMIANAIELEADEVDGDVNDASEHQSHVSYASEQQSQTADGFVAQTIEEKYDIGEEKKKMKYLSKLRAVSLKHV